MSLVLVVDDEPAVLEVLGEVLADLGHEVLRAYDGREALQVARARKPDLVVTDHMMPRMSGAELCRQLRREPQLANVPVILLSAALSEGIPEAQAFLAKPFELSHFEALVARVLREAKPQPLASQGSVPTPPPEGVLVGVVRQLAGPVERARAALGRLQVAVDGPPGEDLAVLERELGELERLHASLRDASALAEGRLLLATQRADVAPLLRGAVSEFQLREPGRQVALSLPAEPVSLSVDPVRLHQMVDALLCVAGEGREVLRLEVTQSSGDRQTTFSFTSGGGAKGGDEDREMPSRESELQLFVAGELARLHHGSLRVEGARAMRVVLPTA